MVTAFQNNKIFLSILTLAAIAAVSLFFGRKLFLKEAIIHAPPGETVTQEVRLQNDFDGAKVSKKDLLQGCPVKDCIPSLENPAFESAAAANQWLQPDDVVFAVNYKNIVKAYPQRIMNWHEIVNDQFEEVPVAVTFCPLCGSAVAFERKVDGVITEFGVSGKLHNNDLVMYDRFEGNLWQQITGEAIVGPAARRDEQLETIPVITTTWKQWLEEQPETVVLSRETGFLRNYDQYPYGTYEQNDELLFGDGNADRSLPIKTVVYGVEIGQAAKAYPATVFSPGRVLNDTVGGVAIRLTTEADGQITVVNTQNNEEIVPTRLFWFAWAAFHPDTELFN